MPVEINALTDDWFQKVDRGEITYREFVAEAKRVGAFIRDAEYHDGRFHVVTCRCVLSRISTGCFVNTIDNKGQVRPVSVRNPSIPAKRGGDSVQCEFHKTVPPEQHFATVLFENSNLFTRFFTELQARPEITETVVDAQGQPRVRFKREFPYRWSFDVNRNLVVNVEGFPLDIKETFRSIATSINSRIIIRG